MIVPKQKDSMSESKNTNKVCVEILSKALEEPITTDMQAYYILERLASCFVEVARDVRNTTIEVYGNGTPGGLKAEVASIRDELAGLKKDIDRGMADIKQMISDDRVELHKPKEDSDSFKKVTIWIVDKLLPHMITAIISVIVGILIWAIRLGAVSAP